MFLLALFLTLLSLLAIYLVWEYAGSLVAVYERNKHIRKIPTCWPVHWLLGNLHQVDITEAVFLGWFKTHVIENKLDINVVWISKLLPTVNISHPRLIKKVLKEPKALNTYRLLLPWLGDGLLVANGEKWQQNRRLLTPAFHVQVLKQYMSIFNSSTQELITKWEKNLEHKKTSTDVLKDFSLLTLDVMLQTAFSYKSHCQSEEKQSKYITNVMEVSELTVQRVLTGYQQLDLIFHLTPSGFRYRRAVSYIHRRTEEIIQERRMSLLRKEEQKRLKEKRRLDLLDVLLTARYEDGTCMPDEQIRNEVNTFLFEGHDTTACGLSWSLYCLAKYPEHQEKCRQEVLKVLGDRTELEWDDLKSLDYTTMCIKEAMRLYPPVPGVSRQTSEDITLEGYFIPKGTTIGINIFGIHRNPRVWDNPEEYNPLRFTPENSKDRDPFAYIPFSAGPRNCIGQQFAMNEAKTVIATILTRFSVSDDPDKSPERQTGLVLKAKDGLWLRLTPLASSTK
jgi:cytochrome P450 family 4 subfamily B polypeptide 1